MKRKISDVILWVLLVCTIFMAAFLQIPQNSPGKRTAVQEKSFVCADTIRAVHQNVCEVGGTAAEEICDGGILTQAGLTGTWENENFPMLLLLTGLMFEISYQMYWKRFLAEAGFELQKDRWLIRYILRADGKKRRRMYIGTCREEYR